MWELAVIPMILNNAETWHQINKESLGILNDLQNTMYRYLLQTPRSTPIPALCWDFGSLSMEDRIIKKKLNFIHHLASLGDGSLAKQVFLIQKAFIFPGLVNEAKKLIEELGLDDITNTKTLKKWSKQSWKRVVKNAVSMKCSSKLKEEILSLDKLKNGPMANEDFETKCYMNNLSLSDARINFKVRSRMLNVKLNYKNDPMNSASLWRCDSCQTGQIESQDHVLYCPAYADLRVDKDINNDSDLVQYMRNVLIVRDNLQLNK